MPVIRQYQTNFLGGSLTPRMNARVDTDAYTNGARELKNARMLVQGGVTRRPGTRYIANLGAPETVKMAEFAFNRDQSYLFIFRPSKLDIYFRDGTFVQQLTGQPWDTAAKVSALRTAQNGDVMIVCQEDMKQQIIRRVGQTNFQNKSWQWETDNDTGKVFQPYWKYADVDVTLKSDKAEGTGATLTASSAVFESGHVGEIIRHKKRQIKITAIGSTNANGLATTATGDILEPLRRDEDTGVNLVADHSFDDDKFWDLGNNWIIRGGKALPESSKVSVLKQEVFPSQGNTHDLTFDVSNRSAGSLTVKLGAVTIGSVSSVGSHSFSFTAETDQDFLVFEASYDFDGDLDNVSLQKSGTSNELVNEGGFDGTEFWFRGGAWVVESSVARTRVKTSFDLQQKVQPQIEKDYVLEFTVTNRNNGTLTVYLDDHQLGQVSSNATHTIEFEAKTTEGQLRFSADVNWDGELDDVKLQMKADKGETTQWDEPVFSSVRGWPRVPYFHSQRMILAASPQLPNGIFMSKPGRFFNFDDGEGKDDDGIAHTIAESRIAEIRAITSLQHLQIFTSEMELYIPTGQARPLTPSNVMFIKQTALGVSLVDPVEFDGAVLFIPRSKSTIREFIFSNIQQAYSSDVISLLSQHIIDNPVSMDATLETADQPEQYAYVLNADGSIAVLLSNRAEKITGWSHYTTSGTFDEIAVVANKPFVLVSRDPDGDNSNEHWLEVLDDGLTLDGAVEQTSGSATDTWTASHLHDATVQVTSGNFYLGEYTADANGKVVLDHSVEKIQIGLGYDVKIETLPPEAQLQDGNTVGEKRRPIKVSAVLANTLNLRVTRQQRSSDLSIRQVTDDLSTEPDKITGRQDFRLLGWDDEGTVKITQSVPLDFTLLGLNVELEV